MPVAVELPIDEIASLCRDHGVVRLAVFGSVLRDDFGPESDVDLLVEFAPGATPGLGFFAIQEELSKLVGRRIDLNTAASLGSEFRDAVLEAAEPNYVAP